jgi:uncharacterized protein YfaS (alpha-2-macroglobulin family)
LPNEHLLVTNIKQRALPGETAKIGISSPFKNVNLLYELIKTDSKAQWIKLSGSKIFDYKITEADRGGFYFNTMYIKDNRWYSTNKFIEVPWTNKELAISLETFRDKILPGSEQTWKLKITGNQKEKVSAELLATMYDASLDAFAPHNLNNMVLYPNNSLHATWDFIGNFAVVNGRPIYYQPFKQVTPYPKSYDYLNWWNLRTGSDLEFQYANDGVMWNGVKSTRGKSMSMNEALDDVQAAPAMVKSMAKMPAGREMEKEEDMVKDAEAIGLESKGKPIKTEGIQLRTNFSETAFFFPDLHTDNEGNIILKFKAPDALTRWKLLGLGHTQDLKSGLLTSTTTTQKDLMIVPNTPRFFREGDKMIYSAKVTNLSDKDVTGTALLQLADATTEQSVDKYFNNINTSANFTVSKGESVPISWDIEIPKGFVNPILVKTFAKAGDVSDGEQNAVPILLNSMLVTETLPLPVRTNTSKDFEFKKLLSSKSSSSLRHHLLTVEYTANPAWYAIQALPYLTDYPHDCAEQTFNRYYANLIATHIANSSPKIKEIFSNWTEKNSGALFSNLSKNQELKSALLQETPWVLEAKNEEEQKRNIATLFNLNRMSKELDRTVRELQILQTPNGGFTWFKGMPDDRFITQYITTGIGRLLHLGIKEIEEERIMTILEKAIPYLDARIKEDYDDLIKHKVDLKSYSPGYFQIHYLYMRSFFLNNDLEGGAKTAFEYFKKQAATYWLQNNRYMQAMLAIALQRYGNKTVPMDIIKSLRENAVHNEEMGMYWKEVGSSYWWYEAPIETQSMLIEAFKEVALNEDEVDELKIWLLKNKQTQNWKTTKATADACYALLLNGTYWLSNESEVTITMGGKKIDSRNEDKEAGTGYFKTSILPDIIKPEMGNINVRVSSKEGDKGSAVNATTWGAVYWQYFEDLDKITPSETPLKLKKQLFIEKNSDKGPLLTPISNNDALKVGDKVKVRIELRVDRDMEYVHMKDMRGACFEPVNVISNYKYQGGLGYYESTKDASTNFFFHWLQKGTYVFEYPMFVTNKGNYSNGIASIQCMYAPEFSSHSEGIRVEVK